MASRKHAVPEARSGVNDAVQPDGALRPGTLPGAQANGRQGGHVIEMQRRRLLGAVVELAYEGAPKSAPGKARLKRVQQAGVRALSVATLCQRAGLSRRTFYDLFEDRDACLHAAFEDAVEAAVQAVGRAAAADTLGGREKGTRSAQSTRWEHGWRERVRAGLSALLSLFDCEPGIGRLLVVEALGCGPPTLEVRRRALAQAAAVIDRGRAEARAGREPPPLTAEGIVGAVFSVIHARMLARDPRPLTELTGSLMALIVHPYLGSAAAQRELEIPMTATQPIHARRLPADPFKDLPIRLTYRTALVLTSIAQAPGASSRQVADASGITDPGQISRLLTRLRTNGLIEDTGVGPAKGMARAWSLTERGEDILQATGQV